MTDHRLLTVAEVAAWLRMSRAWVIQHANGTRGPRLPGVRLGRSWRFRREDVEAFIEMCLREAA